MPDDPPIQTQPVRVLVVDDYAPWRHWVCAELREHQKQVVGEASDGLEAVKMAQALEPTVILLDIGLPKLNGIEAAKRINQSTPGTKIIFLTKENDADIVKHALSTGAKGYVLKEEARADLLSAIEAVLHGERFISGGLAIEPEIEAQVPIFSKVSTIGLAIVDDQRRFRMANDALVAMHNGVPTEAFVGSTIRDIVGEAASGPEARLDRLSLSGETPAIEVTVKLPLRAELPYFIEKNFVSQRKSGKVVQIASLALDVTATRKLEDLFQKPTSKRLFAKEEHQRLAQELHESINEYHAALATNLDRFSRYESQPEKIPELLAQSADFVDASMRKLVAATARCFPKDQRH
jgi:CheY-like chemotaxis protein